jgi:hypothetical protein
MGKKVIYYTYLVSLWTTYVLGGFVSIFIHEASHALLALYAKCKILTFRPYPGTYEYDDGVKWLWGWVQVQELPKDPKIRQLFFIVPLYAGLLFSLIFGLLGIFASKYMFYFAFLEVLDMSNWVQGYFIGGKHHDAQRYKIYE